MNDSFIINVFHPAFDDCRRIVFHLRLTDTRNVTEFTNGIARYVASLLYKPNIYNVYSFMCIVIIWIRVPRVTDVSRIFLLYYVSKRIAINGLFYFVNGYIYIYIFRKRRDRYMYPYVCIHNNASFSKTRYNTIYKLLLCLRILSAYCNRRFGLILFRGNTLCRPQRTWIIIIHATMHVIWKRRVQRNYFSFS